MSILLRSFCDAREMSLWFLCRRLSRVSFTDASRRSEVGIRRHTRRMIPASRVRWFRGRE